MIKLESGEDPDADLVARVGRGEAGAFRLLVDRKLARVHALALRRLGDAGQADDVVQEAFLRIWKHAGCWRRGEARFDTWLHRVVLNLCVDRIRKRREVSVAEPPEQTDPAPGADHSLEQADTARRVRDAIATLPERQREAILLHNYQELSNVEAASAMGLNVDALESLLARARRTLRARLMEVDL